MCNCKKNKANNLDNRVVLEEIRSAYDTITTKGVDNLTDGDWLYLYEVYSRAYPASNGMPNKNDLVSILEKASQLKTAYR
jgi:hypothetical protein